MPADFQLFDVVALAADKPERGLIRGQVGTVVEVLAPGNYEIEFTDHNGRTYGFLSASASELIPLHYEPIRATG